MEPFFATVRSKLGRLNQKQVDGFNAILEATKAHVTSHRAYTLATAWHETAMTMQPISEYDKGRGRAYGVPGRNGGQIAYGRGYVQLTWDDNYERMDRELRLNGKLVKNYELANDPKIAADIMVVGMANGVFTGKSLNDFLTSDRGNIETFTKARRIINGTDKDRQIAQYALIFQEALNATE